MLIMVEEEEEEWGEVGTKLNLTQMELSTFSAGGLTSPKKMKLRGRKGNR